MHLLLDLLLPCGYYVLCLFWAVLLCTGDCTASVLSIVSWPMPSWMTRRMKGIDWRNNGDLGHY